MKYLTTEEGLSRRLAPGMTAQKPRPRCGAGVREVALSRRGRTRGGTVHSTALPLLQLPGAANPAARECRRWRSVLKAPATCSEPHVQRSVAQGPAHPSLALEAGPSPSTSSMPTAPGGPHLGPLRTVAAVTRCPWLAPMPAPLHSCYCNLRRQLGLLTDP